MPWGWLSVGPKLISAPRAGQLVSSLSCSGLQGGSKPNTSGTSRTGVLWGCVPMATIQASGPSPHILLEDRNFGFCLRLYGFNRLEGPTVTSGKMAAPRSDLARVPAERARS